MRITDVVLRNDDAAYFAHVHWEPTLNSKAHGVLAAGTDARARGRQIASRVPCRAGTRPRAQLAIQLLLQQPMSLDGDRERLDWRTRVMKIRDVWRDASGIRAGVRQWRSRSSTRMARGASASPPPVRRAGRARRWNCVMAGIASTVSTCSRRSRASSARSHRRLSAVTRGNRLASTRCSSRSTARQTSHALAATR